MGAPQTTGRTQRLVLLVLIMLAAATAGAQTNSLAVEFRDEPSRSTTIGVFTKGNILYASLSDLSRIFQIATFENIEERKFEIKQPPFRIRVAGGSPFIVVTDQSGKTTTHQLLFGALYAAGSYFVPLESFLPYFEWSFQHAARLDLAARVLRVGPPERSTAFDIAALQIETKTNGTLIRIPCRRPLPDIESWLRPDGWFYLTIAGATVDTSALQAITPEGAVRQIVAIQSPSSAQLTFRSAGKIASASVARGDNPADLLVTLRTPDASEKLAAEKKQIQTGLADQRRRWELDVIVIDPGHGGRDPGASGVTGVKEKDVTLGVGLKLGRLISKNLKSVKVIYTRQDDRFIELDRRGQIANEGGGKLFISIHCNSLQKKPSSTRGFEVYLLRPGRTEEAIAIAERENAAIEFEEGYEKKYKELTEENFILVAMAQSAHVKASELFADFTQGEIEARAKLPNRGVKQAGFYVLVGAAMPNVLVETAYLSNREDERMLKSDAGQQRIADALFAAIKKYKHEYEKLLKEGKEF